MGRVIYPVLTVRQPWAALIVLGLKNIENRNWRLPEKYTGVAVLIHAAAKPVFDLFAFEREMNGCGMCVLPMRAPAAVKSGCIIGAVVFGGCVPNYGKPPLPWCDASSKYWWFIRKAAVLTVPAIPARGRLGFWKWEGEL